MNKALEAVILIKPKDQDDQCYNLALKVDPLIYNLIFIDKGELLKASIRPEFTNFSAEIITFVGLSANQQKIYTQAIADYNIRYKQQKDELKLITIARAAINLLISRTKAMLLDKNRTLREWFKTLKESIALTIGYINILVRKSYINCFNNYQGFQRDLGVQLNKQERIIVKARKYALPNALIG